jgi:hypothetical protein
MTLSSRAKTALLLLLLIGLARNAEPKAQPSGDDYRLSVGVDLAALQATVHDWPGGYVSDLREREFRSLHREAFSCWDGY